MTINNKPSPIIIECPYCNYIYPSPTGNSKYCPSCRKFYDGHAKDDHNQYDREYASEHYVGTYIDGKYIKLQAPYKRQKPKGCEICHKVTQLSYHHWDDSDPSKGIWVCHQHHQLAEALDKDPQVWLAYANLKRLATLDVLYAKFNKPKVLPACP